MQSRILLALVALVLVAVPPALALDRVDLADLDALGDTRLESLRDPDHAVALAEIHVAGAKAREDLANDTVKEAKREKSAEEADLKAANAELDAAKKNQDDSRVQVAQVRKGKASQALDVAKAFQEWKEKEENAAEEALKLAKVELELREAEREYARARLVVEAGTPASARYRLNDYAKAADERRKKTAEAREKWQRVTEEARALGAKWTEMPKP